MAGSGIPLPTRSGGAPGRGGRGIKLPGPEDVQTVSPTIARDPGVQVTPTAYGYNPNASHLGAALSKAGEDVFQAINRQQSLHDFTATNEALQAYDKATNQEWLRRQTEDDPSRPDFMVDFGKYATKQAEDVIAALPKGISDGAQERLRIKLNSNAIGWEENAGKLHLKAAAKRADDALQSRLNTFSAQVEQNPDFLDHFIGQADETIAGLSSNMTAEQRQQAGTESRKAMVQSAVLGMAGQGRFQDATSLVAGNKYADILSAADRKMLDGQIHAARTSQLIEYERAKREAKEAEKKAQDATANAFISRMTPAWMAQNPDVKPLSVIDVVNSNLEPTQKRVFMNALNEQATRDLQPNPVIYNSVMTNIANGTVNSANFTDTVLPYLGHGLDHTAYTSLYSFAQTQEKVGNKVVGDFLKGAKGLISKSTIMAVDPTGDYQFMLFQRKIQDVVNSTLEHGDSVEALFDPENKAYKETIIPVIKAYQRNPLDVMRDSAQGIMQPPNIPQPPDMGAPKARQPGETPEQYLKRMGIAQ